VAAADRSDLRPPGRRYSFGWGSSSHKLTGPAVAATDLLEAPGRLTIQITATAHR
jgi:hypothetical protein